MKKCVPFGGFPTLRFRLRGKKGVIFGILEELGQI